MCRSSHGFISSDFLSIKNISPHVKKSIVIWVKYQRVQFYVNFSGSCDILSVEHAVSRKNKGTKCISITHTLNKLFANSTQVEFLLQSVRNGARIQSSVNYIFHVVNMSNILDQFWENEPTKA